MERKNKQRRLQGVVQPDDWDGVTYCYVILCIPHSSKWLGTVRGALSRMSDYYYWLPNNNQDGQVVSSEIGKDIVNSWCTMCNIEQEIEKLTNAVRVLTAYLDNDGSVFGSSTSVPENGTDLETLGGHSVFRTNNTVFADSSITDLLQSALIHSVDIPIPFDGTPIVRYVRDFYNHWIGDWFNLMNWFASSFRGGAYTDLNPFGYESFFSRFAGAFTQTEFVTVSVPVIGNVRIPTPVYHSNFSYMDKGVARILHEKTFSSVLDTSSLEKVLIGLLSDGSINVEVAVDGQTITLTGNSTDLSAIEEAIKNLNIVAVANSGDESTINLCCKDE